MNEENQQHTPAPDQKAQALPPPEPARIRPFPGPLKVQGRTRGNRLQGTLRKVNHE